MDIHSMLNDIGCFLADYKYIVIIAAAVVIATLVVVFMIKHMPHKGRITDLYDKNGNRKDKKDKKK